MKLGSVPKLDKRNKKMLMKFEDGVMSANYDVHCHFSNFWHLWSNPEAGFLTQSLQKLCFDK